MLDTLLRMLGPFAIPQLALSVLTLGVWLGFALDQYRGERWSGDAPPWRRPLESLGAIAVSLGLLGSVYSFSAAFGFFQGGVDLERIVGALGIAYATTGVGLLTAILASVGSLALDWLGKRAPVAPATPIPTPPAPAGAKV